MIKMNVTAIQIQCNPITSRTTTVYQYNIIKKMAIKKLKLIKTRYNILKRYKEINRLDKNKNTV